MIGLETDRQTDNTHRKVLHLLGVEKEIEGEKEIEDLPLK